jgi:hypothetical protein
MSVKPKEVMFYNEQMAFCIMHNSSGVNVLDRVTYTLSESERALCER